MAESVRTTGFDLCLVVYASALYPRQPPQNPQLHADAVKILAAGQYATFVRLYGDRFIDGLQTGGMYAGILQIHAQTEEVRQQIKTSLEASGAGGELSSDVKASVKQTMNSFKSFASTEVTEKSFGGAPTSNSIDVSAMISTALSFSDTVTPENAYPLYARLADYTELDIPNAAGFADFVIRAAKKPGRISCGPAKVEEPTVGGIPCNVPSVSRDRQVGVMWPSAAASMGVPDLTTR